MSCTAGEHEPVPYFYQNLGEAEYVVATFMFMRLLGYPAHKISILTTYNGQKALIRDVVEQRCAPYPQFGRPHRVSSPPRHPCSALLYTGGSFCACCLPDLPRWPPSRMLYAVFKGLPVLDLSARTCAAAIPCQAPHASPAHETGFSGLS